MIRSKIIRSASSLVIVILLVLLLVFDNESTQAVSAALTLAIDKVIPPLFPYMVISSVIVSCDLLSPISDRIPMDKWLGLPRCTAPVMLMGWLCGYPIGAAGSVKLFESGEISSDDASRLCALSSVCGPAFLLGSVSAMWNSKSYGIILYAAQILFAITSAVLFKKKAMYKKSPTKKTINKNNISFASALCTAVSDAAVTSLVVCAYITFFSVIETMLSMFFPKISFIFKSVLEFSGGCEFGASIGGKLGMVCTGFAVGFGGCSVFMQICNIIGSSNISFRRTFLTKLSGGIILAAISLIFYCFYPLPVNEYIHVDVTYISIHKIIISLIILVFLVFFGKIAGRINYFKTKY